jgi:hypothetical protein
MRLPCSNPDANRSLEGRILPEQPTSAPHAPADVHPQGLSTAEAARRAAQGRANRMPRTAEGGVAAIVRRNIFTLFNLINLLMAALLVWVGSYRNLLFLGGVVCNAGIGLVQELRAKRMHDRLQVLSEGRGRTLRDGAETPLPPAELVEGDVIRLRRGDQLPGDGLALEGNAAVNEALLTGESEPLPKAAGDALLSGSYLTEGSLTVRLTAVGERSYAGRLQKNARRIRRPHSELMASLQRVIRWVSVGLVPLGAALYLRQTAVLGLATPTAVTKTVGAMLGMIPEGLMLLTSVALAVGVVRLGRRNALVNELYGIENLARVDVLCLDKTGTLTGGRTRRRLGARCRRLSPPLRGTTALRLRPLHRLTRPRGSLPQAPCPSAATASGAPPPLPHSARWCSARRKPPLRRTNPCESGLPNRRRRGCVCFRFCGATRPCRAKPCRRSAPRWRCCFWRMRPAPKRPKPCATLPMKGYPSR